MGRTIQLALMSLMVSALLISSLLPSHSCYTGKSSIEVRQYRQSNITNYTQLGLNFISDNYPGKNVTYIDSYVQMDGETQLSYTILDADVYPGYIQGLSDTVEISIRHDTKHVEFGKSQINEDAMEYYLSLPRYYQHCSYDTRIVLLSKFGHLPTLEETKTMHYRTNASFQTDSANKSFLREKIGAMGYDYSEGEIFGIYTILVDDMKLHDALCVTDNVFIIEGSFYDYYEYSPEKSLNDGVKYISIGIIIFYILALVYFITYDRTG